MDLFLGTAVVWATGASISDIFDGAYTFLDILLAAVVFGGVIMIVKAVIDLSSAITSHDNTSIKNAVMGLAGGLMMVGVGSVLALMGISW